MEEAFKHIDLKITWKVKALTRSMVDQYGEVRVRVDSIKFRRTEVEFLHGDCSKAKKARALES